MIKLKCASCTEKHSNKANQSESVVILTILISGLKKLEDVLTKMTNTLITSVISLRIKDL